MRNIIAFNSSEESKMRLSFSVTNGKNKIRRKELKMNNKDIISGLVFIGQMLFIKLRQKGFMAMVLIAKQSVDKVH